MNGIDAPEFRVTVRLRNNRLIRLREDLGLTQAEMGRRIGTSQLSAYETLAARPMNRLGEWKPAAVKIAEYHGVSPEYIWPEAVQQIAQPRVEREMTSRALLAGTSAPQRLLEQRSRATALREAIASLPDRERRVIEARFFEDKTFDETATEHDVSRERIRQIEHKALRKLRRRAGVLGQDCARCGGEAVTEVRDGFRMIWLCRDCATND